MTMSNKYYALIASLPELSLNDMEVKFDMVEFREQMKSVLSTQHYRLLQALYYSYDIRNLVFLTVGQEEKWLPQGNFNKETLRSFLIHPDDDAPPFFVDFINYINDNPKERNVKHLISTGSSYYINWSATVPNWLLNNWLRFLNNLKNLMIWLNSHKFDRDPTEEVLGDYFEAEYLRNAIKAEIDLKAWDFKFREVLTHFDNPNIALREYFIDKMKWTYINELEEPYSFSIENILAYAIKLRILNRNIETTEEKGEKVLQQLMEGLLKEHKIPDSF